VWIFLPASLMLAGVAAVLFRTLPTVDGELRIAGLASPVSISRDTHSIPGIQAASDHDAYFALGFVHAQDRLWQMEMNRRIGAGRLSEILGESAVGGDIMMRRLGLYQNARKTWAALDQRSRDVLRVYAGGVNAGMAALRVLPVEFVLKRHRPEPWVPEDSLVLMQVMAWKYSGNADAEIQRLLLIQHHGLDVARALMPGTPAQLPAVTAQASDRGWQDYLALSSAGGLLGAHLEAVGSNGWVLSGKYTASGAPLLANDPHLTTPIPAIWYLATVKGGALDVAGATMPGLPFFFIGKNSNIAWGLTNAHADTQDVVLEQLNPVNKDQYLDGGTYVDMEIHRETIYIKNDFLRPVRAPEVIDVRRTRHGPLVSDISPTLGKMPFSIMWTGDLDTGGTFQAFLRMNYAGNWDEFRQALSGYVAPVHNFIYADRWGNIGHIAPGAYPLRVAGDGSIPVRAGQSDIRWKKYIPYQEQPHSFNPPEGFIVSANQKNVSDDYPYYISSDWSPAYRAKRISAEIERLISNKAGRISAADMFALQLDVVTPGMANQGLKALGKLKGETARQERVLALIRNWDGAMSTESVEALIYSSWMSHVNIALIEKLKSESVRSNASGEPLDALKYRNNQEFIESVLTGATREQYEGLLLASLEGAIVELQKKLGEDLSLWKWGKVHQLKLAHFPFSKPAWSPDMPLAEESVLSTVFDRSQSTGGGDNTVNNGPASFERKTKYMQFFGAMYRQVVDLGSASGGYFMMGTGQSGNPVSSHYDDMIEAHQHGDYLPMSGRPQNSTLVLRPFSGK
jgi:penicillin amidase